MDWQRLCEQRPTSDDIGKLNLWGPTEYLPRGWQNLSMLTQLQDPPKSRYSKMRLAVVFKPTQTRVQASQ